MRSVLIASVLVMLACGDDNPTVTTAPTSTPTSDPTADPTGKPPTGDDTADEPTGDPPATSTTATTEPPASSPQILSLQTNVSKLTAGESVVFTAVLTDSDGLADIVGGTLSDTTGVIGYGPFVAAGQPGTYSISLSWEDMHQAEPIQFEGMDLVRVFRAEFYDLAANKVSEDVELALTCAEGSSCDGVCLDIMTDAEHCGSCAGVCGLGCEGGSCTPAWGECFGMTSFTTCNEYCAANGESCVEDGCEGYTLLGYSGNATCMEGLVGTPIHEPCDFNQTWGSGRLIVQCCCSDTP